MTETICWEDEPLKQSPELVLQFHRPKAMGVARFYPKNPDAFRICDVMDRNYLPGDKLDAIRKIGCIRIEVI